MDGEKTKNERETGENHEVGVGARVHTAYYRAHYSIEKPSLDIQVKARMEIKVKMALLILPDRQGLRHFNILIEVKCGPDMAF